MRLLITGATGKIGSHLLPALLADNRFNDCRIVVLCHNRSIDAGDRVETVRGSLSDRAVVEEAMSDVTHVIHMAAVKESPDLAMDVSVKGMFLLLEAFRASSAAHQFILIGGDCSVGHIFHRYEGPVTEELASPCVSGMLCFDESHRRGNAGTISNPVWNQRLLPACPVDHGKRRFSICNDLRRRPVWRTRLD